MFAVLQWFPAFIIVAAMVGAFWADWKAKKLKAQYAGSAN